MDIYPTHLYIKQHSITGMKYFGKTIKPDPVKYMGSGKYWLRHVKHHGKEYVNTIWVSELFTDIDELREFALAFSEMFNIVESPEWANLQEENGIDGGTLHTTATKQKISRSKLGKHISEEHKRATSLGRKGKPLSEKALAACRSLEYRQKMSEMRRGKSRPTKNCPHCGKTGGVGNMDRWHFDNCKHKPV